MASKKLDAQGKTIGGVAAQAQTQEEENVYQTNQDPNYNQHPIPGVSRRDGLPNTPSAQKTENAMLGATVPSAALGLPIPAAISAGMAQAFPDNVTGTTIGQNTGSALMEALMNKIAPGAGYIPRALGIGGADYAGGAVGNQIDRARGVPQQSQGTRGIGAVLSGLLGGFGAKPGTPPQPKGTPGDFASGLPEYVDRAAKSPKSFLLSFIKGDDEVVTVANKQFNEFVESRGAVLSQDQLVDVANTVKQKALKAAGNSGAVSSAEKRFIRAANMDTPTPERLLGAMFGETKKGFDPALAMDAAATLDNYLKSADPQLAQQVKNTFFVRGVVYGSLKNAEEGQSGVKKLIETVGDRTRDMASDRAAVGPGGLINYGLTQDTGEYILDGVKFQKHIKDLGPNLDTIFGKGSQAALEDVAEVMKVLDPAVGGKGFKQTAAAFLGASLKYNANRLIFYTSQLGTGGGGQAMGGLLKGGLLASSAVLGAVHLDEFAMYAVKNPGAVKALRFGLEQGKPEIVRVAMRNLLSTSKDEPFPDPEQPKPEAIPVPGRGLTAIR